MAFLNGVASMCPTHDELRLRSGAIGGIMPRTRMLFIAWVVWPWCRPIISAFLAFRVISFMNVKGLPVVMLRCLFVVVT